MDIDRSVREMGFRLRFPIEDFLESGGGIDQMRLMACAQVAYDLVMHPAFSIKLRSLILSQTGDRDEEWRFETPCGEHFETGCIDRAEMGGIG